MEYPNCGQKNRISDENISETKCAKCWKIIYKNPKESAKEKGNYSPYQKIYKPCIYSFNIENQNSDFRC